METMGFEDGVKGVSLEKLWGLGPDIQGSKGGKDFEGSEHLQAAEGRGVEEMKVTDSDVSGYE